MAWRFRVAGKTVTVENVSLLVEYFDDQPPKPVLHTKIFNFVPGTTKADALSQIRLEGRIVKEALEENSAFALSFLNNEEATL